MKKFIFTVLCVSVFFIGLGSVVDKVGARFKSDQKALDLIKAARTAIGGDNSIAGIQSLRIKGNTVHSWKIDGNEKTEPGGTEIAIQLPDRLSKMSWIGNPEEDNGSKVVSKQVETVVVTGKDENVNLRIGRGDGQGTGIGTEPGTKVIILKKGDELPQEIRTEGGKTIVVRNEGDNQMSAKVENGEVRRMAVNKEEMEARHKATQQNELFRLTLGLLLSPPSGMDANYTFGGETSIDGTPCNVVLAEFGGSSIKLALNKNSNLPVQMTYSGEAMPMIFTFKTTEPAAAEGDTNVMFFRRADTRLEQHPITPSASPTTEA